MYQITWEPQGVIRTFTGIVKRAEVTQALRDSATDPRLISVKFSINDFSGCQALIANHEALDEIAQVANNWRQDHPTSLSKVAFVVCDPTITVELKDYAQSVSKGANVEFFTSIEIARKWVEE